jgi:diguanylate cyclase (GGDEF)-like protein
MNKPTIICIDDEKYILDSLRDQISRSLGKKFLIELVESGQEALEVLEELSEAKIDIPLIICDQTMPKMSGDVLLPIIHSYYPKTLKIMLTGMATVDNLAQAINNAGLYRYLSKPWDEADLSLTIKQAIRCYYREKQLSIQNIRLQTINRQLKQEVKQHKVTEKKLINLALYDSLTGLPNRKHFLERVAEVFDEFKVKNIDKFAIMFIDLDRFKIINDSLGHLVGDQLLTSVAQRLQKCLRTGDMVARLGGDEFTILLPCIHDLNDAIDIANRILNSLSKSFDLQEQRFGITASIGIIFGSSEYGSIAELLRDADTAMYHAKKNGKGRYSVFQKEMHLNAQNQWNLETALQNAIEKKEFDLHYQPIISLNTGDIVAVESLIRWCNSEGKFFSPDEFIPMAEESGLILKMGEWVLEKGCRQLKHWQCQFPKYRDLKLSVNFSGKQLSQPDCILTIDHILERADFNPRFLILELTESILIDDTETIIAKLQKLRERNIHLSIDDFGKGYSSMSYLHKLPVNTLKIDRLFTDQINDNSQSLNIVKGITSLAHNLDLKVVVEGIETEEQLSQIKILDCDFGQGYYFYRPLNSSGMEKLLASV